MRYIHGSGGWGAGESMASKEKKITSANLMASTIPLRFRIGGGGDGRRLGTRNTRSGGGGGGRMKCHRHRNASRFFPLYITIYSSSFILFSLGFCIGVCFWVMHSGSSSQMMYPAFVRPPQEKKSEKEYVPYFGLCWPYKHTHKSRTTDVTVKSIIRKLPDIRACVCLP
jgi:hypothetical protein